MAITFPNITHIDQVLPAIEGRSEFTHGKNSPHFDLVAYYLLDNDTFKSDDPNIAALRRECRGLIFHKDGTIARRAFHKFFNVGETDETMPENLDISVPHMVLEKLDGSMVGPFISHLDGNVFWASMRGSHDYNDRLGAIYNGTDYEALVRAADTQGLTAIFEFCSLENRIIVEYGETQMVLLALRHRETGAYSSRTDLMALAAAHNIPVVQPLPHPAKTIDELIPYIRRLEGKEGSVISFEDGRLVKLKGEWYSQLHKLLANFEFEKDIARLILSGNQDDMLGILNAERRNLLINYQDDLLSGVKSAALRCAAIGLDIRENDISRKDFATSDKAPSSVLRAIIFKHFDNLEGADYFVSLVEAGLSRTGSDAKWQDFKVQIGLDINWDVDD